MVGKQTLINAIYPILCKHLNYSKPGLLRVSTDIANEIWPLIIQPNSQEAQEALEGIQAEIEKINQENKGNPS